MQLAGKTALVTGGGSGLGAACVAMIREAGGRGVVLDQSASSDPDVICADVTSAHAVESAVQALRPLHVLVNCAGISPSQRTVGRDGAVPLETFARTIAVNLVGTFNAIRVAAAAMVENEPNQDGERGVIVNTASIAAFDGQIGQAAYAASKAGVCGLTLPLARELARHGIRVVTIAPGIFDTPMLQSFSDDVRATLAAAVPFPSRLGHAAEYASLVRHIVENPMLNGETIRLDGALRMAPK